jgi:hypothetical protein
MPPHMNKINKNKIKTKIEKKRVKLKKPNKIKK